MAEAPSVDFKQIAKTGLYCGVKIKNVRQFRFRVKVAEWLIRLAFWVMWTKCDVELLED